MSAERAIRTAGPKACGLSLSQMQYLLYQLEQACGNLIEMATRPKPIDDVVFDNGGALLRVQVKSTTRPRPVPNRPGSAPSYMFHVRRAGKGSKRIIGDDEFDILALVALDIRVVAYVAITDRVLQVIHLRVPGQKSSHQNAHRGTIEEYPISAAIERLRR